jgi:hypothetical protein
MTLVVGTDEAGYGPNLGPLVVAATVWRADASPADLEATFAAAAAGLGGLWGDSKSIYRGGAGLAALECGVLAGLAACGATPGCWADLLSAIGASGSDAVEWAAVANRSGIHRAADPAACAAAAAAAHAAVSRHGLRLVAVRCRVLQPREFNARIAAGLNKSDVLSQVTLDLAAAVAEGAGEDRVVWCDRHGGRRRYAPLVSRSFAAPLVQVVAETPAWSAYHVPDASCRVEFSVRGESRLPVALASMTAKYVRELSMAAFNAWWCGRVEDLAPTAGYPLDAARWRRDVEAAGAVAAADWDDLWRSV